MRTTLIAAVVLLAPTVTVADTKPWKAGVAVRTVTPTEPMWLAGYASRDRPAEGKEQDLFVKALALEDPTGHRVVLVTSDLIGIPRTLADDVAAAVKKRTGLARDQLLLTVSHTHCGPVVRDNLADMYPMPPVEAKKLAPYAEKLTRWMTEAVVEAVGKLAPCQLAVGEGTARFAVNRRLITDKGVVGGANPAGPVDHAVPVLRVTANDKLLAVVFGYACHNTTMQFYRWCGDYAGYAQEYIEAKHPGAVALFWSGCGADANPLPRSKLELCKKYGRELADAVEAVLGGKPVPVTGVLRSRYSLVELAYDKLPDKAQLAADRLGKNYALSKRAEGLERQMREAGKIDDHYRHYPVQVWALGDQVTWVSLGGEVVVDYALRLKKELPSGRKVWVTAYANDVMAYVPSVRVLREGGYEADSSMIYYGLPSKWAASVEGRILDRTRELVKQVTK